MGFYCICCCLGNVYGFLEGSFLFYVTNGKVGTMFHELVFNEVHISYLPAFLDYSCNVRIPNLLYDSMVGTQNLPENVVAHSFSREISVFLAT